MTIYIIIGTSIVVLTLIGILIYSGFKKVDKDIDGMLK